jgi:hypothetical protein
MIRACGPLDTRSDTRRVLYPPEHWDEAVGGRAIQRGKHQAESNGGCGIGKTLRGNESFDSGMKHQERPQFTIDPHVADESFSKGVRAAIDDLHRKGIATYFMEKRRFYKESPDGTIYEIKILPDGSDQVIRLAGHAHSWSREPLRSS